MIAQTERLRIRRMTSADAAFVCRLLNEPSWLQNIGDRGVRTSTDAASYIESKIMQAYETLGFGMYLVESSADSVPMGMCGLVQRETLPVPDMGFAFLPEFWGKGYAHEASIAVMRHAVGQLGLVRLLAIVAPDNERSCKLLETLGFAHEGEYRSGPNEERLKKYAMTLNGSDAADRQELRL